MLSGMTPLCTLMYGSSTNMAQFETVSQQKPKTSDRDGRVMKPSFLKQLDTNGTRLSVLSFLIYELYNGLSF